MLAAARVVIATLENMIFFLMPVASARLVPPERARDSHGNQRELLT